MFLYVSKMYQHKTLQDPVLGGPSVAPISEFLMAVMFQKIEKFKGERDSTDMTFIPSFVKICQFVLKLLGTPSFIINT